MFPRHSCVWEIAGWSDELAASLGSVHTGVEGRNCDKIASHKGRRKLTRRLFEIIAVLLSPMRLLRGLTRGLWSVAVVPLLGDRRD